MKKSFLVLAFFILLLTQNCQNEEDSVSTLPVTQQQAITDAKNWFGSNVPLYPTDQSAKSKPDYLVLWDDSKITLRGKDNYIMVTPILKQAGSVYQVITYREKGIVQGYVVQFIPDNDFFKNPVSAAKGFSGKIILRDRKGYAIKSTTINEGKPVINNTSTLRVKDESGGGGGWYNGGEATVLGEVTITTTTYQDNTYYVIYNTSGQNGNNNGGDNTGGGGSSGSAEYQADNLVMTVDGGGDEHAKPIPDIKKHIECFTPNESARVSIHVDQPINNSTSPINVVTRTPGHAFLTIEQNGNTRTIGFYPRTSASVFSKEDDGQLMDNAGKEWDVSVSFYVSSDEFSDLLNYIEGTPANYNLDTFNCTNWAAAAVGAMGIYVPQTEVSWPGGGGLSPAQFGQDLKNWSPGARNVETKGFNGETGNAPTNTSTCP